MISYENATGRLLRLYDQCKNPDGSIDRVLKVHSLRPRTLYAHLSLYKATLHTNPNELTYRERELIGTYTSLLNGCDYCVQHHKTGLGRELDDQELATELLNAAINLDSSILSEREIEILKYTKKLTLHPNTMKESDLLHLRNIGLSDKGILDLNQIISYFNYVNRTVNGLGVDILGETLGFHPDENSDGFGHV